MFNMNLFVTEFILLITFSTIQAYDIFEGLFQLGEPCFDIVHFEGCNTSISKALPLKRPPPVINSPDTTFWLFTPTNPEKAEPLHKCGGRLHKDSNFDTQVDTVVIVHGWLDGLCRTAWMREIKAQLFIRGKYNVILVDWTWINTIDIPDAGQSTIFVGKQLAHVVKNIMMQKNVNGDMFHFIGHSFGTFVVSRAGRFIRNWKKENKIRRLTWLDPAVAMFPNGNISHKLSHEDGKFVDVVHGDGGHCFPVTFGFAEPLGHADFYPNGGDFQLACYPYILTSILKGDLVYGLGSLVFPPVCSHLHAIQYFKVSINHPNGLYVGVECDSYAEFTSGACKRCCKNNSTSCAVAGMDAEAYFPLKNKPRRPRKYYFNLGILCPYNEDYEFSIYKNC